MKFGWQRRNRPAPGWLITLCEYYNMDFTTCRLHIQQPEKILKKSFSPENLLKKVEKLRILQQKKVDLWYMVKP